MAVGCPWLRHTNLDPARLAPLGTVGAGDRRDTRLDGGTWRINTVTSQNTCSNVPPTQRRSTTALCDNRRQPRGSSTGKYSDKIDNQTNGHIDLESNDNTDVADNDYRAPPFPPSASRIQRPIPRKRRDNTRAPCSIHRSVTLEVLLLLLRRSSRCKQASVLTFAGSSLTDSLHL